MEPQPATPPQEFDFPKVSVHAHVSTDGKRITLIIPAEFIKETVAIAADNYGRHRLILGPAYGGQDVVGFLNPAGVKYGKVELNAAAYDLKNLIPNKQGKYWGKQRDYDILLGRLLSDLCEQKAASVVQMPTRERDPQPVEVREVIKEVPQQITIEAAVDFVNEWAAKNDGRLVVEDNALAIEIQKRIGGKKHG